ncbi:MAG: aldo/keto reductase [Actinobacteria bacterium]|nr:aldo/keto reductase [Actinomycetota bacterium]MCB9412593.1 aldo/keto reductase [Actinomycetota bacterium]
MSTVPNVLLNNGVLIPQLGFGTFKVPPEKAEEVTLQALEIGYRHLDTAQMYGNERGVGAGVRASGLPREEIFVTTKLNNGRHGRDQALAAFDASLDALGFDYVDLFLVHWPLPARDQYVEAWRALAEIAADGRARAIGVSNFHQEHLRRLADECEVVPAVNQIEVHPYLTQDALRAFDAEAGIATEAWSPLARGRVLDDPVVVQVADAVARTPSQVVLRWAIQRGDIVFPKSSDPGRMAENFDLFDFDLSEQQMAAISALNRDERTGPNPDEFNWIPQ